MGNDALFRTLVHLLDLPELAVDDAYRTNTDRVANREVLHDTLQARLTQRSAAEWQETFQAHGIPCSPVRTVADLAADPQLDALGLLAAIPSPDVPDLRLVDVPFSMDLERATHRYPPPRLGEHAVDVLGEVGYSAPEVADLRRRGVVG